MRKLYSAALAVMLVGCASTGVIPTDQGKYMISKTSGGGMFVSGEQVKADLYVEANEFCAKRDQVVETIKAEGESAIPFVRSSRASLEFRCVAR